MRDDVRRPHGMPLEELMEPVERVQVLEFLIPPRGGIPLVVAFRIDRDEQDGRGAHRS